MKLTRDVVLSTALSLIAENGKTTTLEVKTSLRSQGYWARQSDVRNMMLDITNADGVLGYRETDRGFREYFDSRTTQTIPAVTGTAQTKIKSDNIPADYEVWDGYDAGTILIFNGVTRGQAKHQWSQTMQRHIFDARTSRLS